MTRPPITVREANVDDVPWLLDECERFAATYPIPLWPGRDYAMGMLLAWIDGRSPFTPPDAGPNEPLAPFFVAVAGNTRVGFIAGAIGHELLHTLFHADPPITLQERLWWVVPEYRFTRAGWLLLDRFLAFASENRYRVVLGAVVGVTQFTGRAAAKRGFTPGPTYLMKITESGRRMLDERAGASPSSDLPSDPSHDGHPAD